MALDADNAKTTNAATTMVLGLENRLKLAKMIVSQKISTNRNGAGIELSSWANSNRRVCTRSAMAWTA